MEENKKNEYINFKHLKRFLTCQPYYVWNPTAVNFNEETDSEEFSFWQIDLDEVDDLSYAEVIKNGYSKVNAFFEAHIKKEAKQTNRKVFINREIKPEIAFKKTIEKINDPDVDWIVNPVFIYQDCVIKPILFRKDYGILSSLIHSSKSKLKNYIQAYFEINVLQKLAKQLKIELSDYSFFNYDSKQNYQVAPDLQFEESSFCWTQKSGPAKDIKTSIEEHNQDLTILEKINSRIITKSKKENLPSVYFSYDFDQYIEKIRASKNIKKPEQLNDKDLTDWGVNDHFNELFPFEQYGIPHVSGSLIKKNELLDLLKESKKIYELQAKKKSLYLVCKQENKIDYFEVERLINLIRNEKCVWYDFEGFSMPFAIFKKTKPYQQLVFQVSVIKTDDDKINDVNNLVVDPQTININDFKNIVDAIYDPTADKYVVYNQSYENTRLKEMKEILASELDADELATYEQKINHITDNTFDLLELFKITNANDKIPPIFLHKLLGFSSIKKLENLITNSQIQLPIMIKPYKSLDVQNGLMAMNKAIQRYLNGIGDIEWKEDVKRLKDYCENDVMAMIMVYHFVLKLLQEEDFINQF